MNDTPMSALVVSSDQAGDAALAVRVLQDNGDQATHCVDVPEALSRVAQGGFDVAFVSLSLPRGDGLALVHHLRALYPALDLVAMVRPDEIEEAGSAMALGVLSTVVTPLTGDDVLVTVDRIRERRILLQQRQAGEARKPGTERVPDTLRRCAAFVAPLSAQVPAGLKMRVDRSTNAEDPDDRPDLKVVTAGKGFRVTGGPAGVFWMPNNTAMGNYTVKATFTLLQPSNHTNYYGLVVGGSDLEGANQAYTYFIVAQNGMYQVKQRMGEKTSTLQRPMASPAIKTPAAGAGPTCPP